MARAVRVGVLALLLVPVFALAAWLASSSLAMTRSVARPPGATLPVVEVKIKCGLADDGKLVCKNEKKNDKDLDESGASKPKNKCKGPNDCGDGYRDLEQPNRYGACCEAVKDAPVDPVPQNNQRPPAEQKKEVPQSGGCRVVEKMNEMSCGAGAISCGALEGGKMTCCCR